MIQSAHFNQPPPTLVNLSVPPPMPGVQTHFPPPRFQTDVRNQGHRPHFFQPFRPFARPGGPGVSGQDEFDGKRLRKSVMRKTVDYNAAVIKMLENRVCQRDFRDRRALQPDVTFCPDMEPPSSYVDNPINSVTTRFVKTATNKMRCPIFCMAWTPEGRRLVTGASSGEFTLWNGLTFNFETILQAHDSPVRSMVWSHNDFWMVTGDHSGYVKYWQSNMNNVKMFQAHKEALRGLSFSPSDNKFVTCSDDGTLRIWDFLRCHEERILRGHGADVKCVHWHPQKSLIISGSKDNQQPVKLWDSKSGQALATLHAHKSTVMDVKWNANGNWVVTASRDHLLKLFDIRNLSQEVQTFRGHKKEASSVAWHPYHEGLFASGGSDGAILFWQAGTDKEVGAIEQAHDSIVWTLAWHPLGHILCSGSNDHTSKFWTRNRPGDAMRDKYNLNTLPPGLAGLDGDLDLDEPAAMIPGMGPEDRVALTEEIMDSPSEASTTIPGLDLEGVDDKLNKPFHKKVPYSKPIPRNFMAQWNETNKSEDKDENSDEDDAWQKQIKALKDPLNEVITQLIEAAPIPGIIPLSELNPQAVIVYGKILPIDGNPTLAEAISQGGSALNRLITSGELEELQDVMPHIDEYDVPSDEGSDAEGSQGDTETNNGSIGLAQSLNPLSTSDLTKTTSTSTSSSASLSTKRVRKSRFSDIEEKASSSLVKIPQTGMPSLSTLESSSATQSVESRFLARPSNTSGPNQDQDMRSGGLPSGNINNIGGSVSMGPNSGTTLGPSPHNFGSYSDMPQRPQFPGGPPSQIWDRKRRWDGSEESSSNLSNSNNMNINNMGPNMNNINSNNMGPNNMNKLPHNSMNIGPSKMNMGPNSMGPNNMGSNTLGKNMGPNMGPNSHGPNMGPNSHGPNMGPNSMGSNMGSKSMGHNNMGPNSMGHNMGPNSMGPSNMGPNNMGPNNMGPNNMGPNNMGPNNMGPNNMGPNNMGPNNMGPNNMGPNNMGPNNMGPNNMGPNSMGPNNMGHNNIGPNNMGMMNKNNYGYQGYGGGFGPPPPRGPWNKQDENMMRGSHYPGPRGPRFEPRGAKMRPSGPMPRGPPHFRPPRMQGPPRGPWQGNR